MPADEKEGAPSYDNPLGDKVAFSLPDGFNVDFDTLKRKSESEYQSRLTYGAVKIVLHAQLKKRKKKFKAEQVFAQALLENKQLDNILSASSDSWFNVYYVLDKLTKVANSIPELKSALALPWFYKSMTVNPTLCDACYQILKSFVDLLAEYPIGLDSLFLSPSPYGDRFKVALLEILPGEHENHVEHGREILKKLLNKSLFYGDQAVFDAYKKETEEFVNYKEELRKKIKKSKEKVETDYLKFRFENSGLDYQEILQNLQSIELVPLEYKLEDGRLKRVVFLDSMPDSQQPVLEAFFDEFRFELIEGRRYRKKKLPGDKPNENREYVQDARGIFLPRYVYRYIRSEERIALSALTGLKPDVQEDMLFYPDQYHKLFHELEGTSKYRGFAVFPSMKREELVLALHNELGEFSLNRYGHRRFIATAAAADKYDLRSNAAEGFLQSASDMIHESDNRDRNHRPVINGIKEIIEEQSKGEKRGKDKRERKAPGKEEEYDVQGGGVVRIDLSLVSKEFIRCQYKAKSRQNMRLVEDFILAISENGKLKKGDAIKREIQEAKKSAVRNREVHLLRIPYLAITGWKPYMHFSVWLERKYISKPLIYKGSAALSYHVDSCPLQHYGLVKILDGNMETDQEAEEKDDNTFKLAINALTGRIFQEISEDGQKSQSVRETINLVLFQNLYFMKELHDKEAFEGMLEDIKVKCSELIDSLYLVRKSLDVANLRRKLTHHLENIKSRWARKIMEADPVSPAMDDESNTALQEQEQDFMAVHDMAIPLTHLLKPESTVPQEISDWALGEEKSEPASVAQDEIPSAGAMEEGGAITVKAAEQTGPYPVNAASSPAVIQQQLQQASPFQLKVTPDDLHEFLNESPLAFSDPVRASHLTSVAASSSHHRSRSSSPELDWEQLATLGNDGETCYI